MRFEKPKKVGSAIRSARHLPLLLFAVSLAFASGPADAQVLYKYRGDNGEWIYSDQAPQEDAPVEIRDLQKGEVPPSVTVSNQSLNGRFRIIARNDYYAPVQVVLELQSLENLTLPRSDQQMHWVVPARSAVLLLELGILNPAFPAYAEYQDGWLPGDPNNAHSPATPYRLPFAIASHNKISQAYPMALTHSTPDSIHAVDFVMPVGTDVHAARAGVVFDVASTNFGGGFSYERYLHSANVVRILHDDGSYAVYAHLNWNSVRVKPGDKVERGQYIADSGNTGVSSGPHLHFAVIRNKGLELESVPIAFEGLDGGAVTPVSGMNLVAY